MKVGLMQTAQTRVSVLLWSKDYAPEVAQTLLSVPQDAKIFPLPYHVKKIYPKNFTNNSQKTGELAYGKS
jgi:hypothetical protein